ncbi:MAG: hypothetical protein H2041_16960 [Phenylobacterium sp.]|uniref:PfkB family carbohydrate kinase n=1 Tax=Phenylobacterium sp. TaxID=1871053 RepID=UPI0017EC012C|nr:PfkB family carbohydrate kinase [Phenylobacterium sp.]MBA4795352.1 hypothetical protein [Phenylobacterium sp.]
MAEFLVIGALALDRPVWLSAPIQRGGRVIGRTLGGRLEPRLGGGAANAGVALRKAGHRVAVASAVAADAGGDDVLARAREAGLDVDLVVRRAGESRMTLLLIDPDGERVVMGLDAASPLPAPPPLPTPDQRSDLTPEGVYVRTPYPGAAAWAARSAGPVVLHWPAPGYDGPADVVVCSADDLPRGILAAPFEAARAALGPRLTWVVVTYGADGARAHDGRNELFAAPPPARALDSTGAGDVFAAGLLDALRAGAAMEAALAHASAWGAATVELASSAPVDAPAGLYRPYPTGD